jgi:hypothetical protein
MCCGGVGHFGTSQPRPLRLLRRECFWTHLRFRGTDAKAPPDPPCEQIPAAFRVELVILEGLRFVLQLLVVLRTETRSVCVPEHLRCLSSSCSWQYRQSSRAGAA